MADFFSELLKFFSKLSWRKLFALLVFAVVALAVLFLYEQYTASFRLSRLQKATDLLAHLQEIQAHGTNSTRDFQRAYAAVLAQTIEAVEEKPISLKFIPSTYTFSMDSLWRFIAGGALWFVLACFQIPKMKTKEGSAAFSGLLILAAASGFVGMFIRPIWWPWFHLLIYPWLFLAAMATAALPVAFAYVMHSGLKAARDKAKEIVCITNLKQVGLGARLWANDHGGVLPSDFASMKKELGSEGITFCPADDAAQYEIASPGCAVSNSSVVYARCRIHANILFADGSAQHLGKNGRHAAKSQVS